MTTMFSIRARRSPLRVAQPNTSSAATRTANKRLGISVLLFCVILCGFDALRQRPFNLQENLHEAPYPRPRRPGGARRTGDRPGAEGHGQVRPRADQGRQGEAESRPQGGRQGRGEGRPREAQSGQGEAEGRSQGGQASQQGSEEGREEVSPHRSARPSGSQSGGLFLMLHAAFSIALSLSPRSSQGRRT